MRVFIPKIFGFFCLAFLSVSCVQDKKVVAPSVYSVKTNAASASLSVNEASQASLRSSANIKKFKTNAERIEYKSIKALELL